MQPGERGGGLVGVTAKVLSVARRGTGAMHEGERDGIRARDAREGEGDVEFGGLVLSAWVWEMQRSVRGHEIKGDHLWRRR